jgi:hypothetical protein
LNTFRPWPHHGGVYLRDSPVLSLTLGDSQTLIIAPSGVPGGLDSVASRRSLSYATAIAALTAVRRSRTRQLLPGEGGSVTWGF